MVLPQSSTAQQLEAGIRRTIPSEERRPTTVQVSPDPGVAVVSAETALDMLKLIVNGSSDPPVPVTVIIDPSPTTAQAQSPTWEHPLQAIHEQSIPFTQQGNK